MPPKKYQSMDDPDSDEEIQEHQQEQLEEKLLPPPVERSDEPKNEKPKDLPKRIDGNKRLIDRQALLNAIEEGVITLNRSQQKKLLPKIAPIEKNPRPKRVITDEQRERLMKQLAKAHETNRKKRLLKEEEQISLKEKHKNYIEKNMIAIEDKTMRGKKAPPSEPKKKKVVEKVEEVEEEVKTPVKPKPKREYVEPNNYPSDDETEGDTTDTRSIKRVNKKLKMVRKPLQQQQQQQQSVEYKDLSLLDKLKYRL